MTKSEPTMRGGPLSEEDYARLAESWIDRPLADQALLRRVTSAEGAEVVGRKAIGSHEGILFPYIHPGEVHVREYRLRRDHPEFEMKDGITKERNKYLSPPGRGNMLYFVPGTDPALLGNVGVPIILTEGEKKTLALHRLSRHEVTEASVPRFLPIGLPGVWNWRGTIGKEPGPKGERRDVKGPIPDLDRVDWKGRSVYIAFDSNVHDNRSVASARNGLTAELRKRGAEVCWVDVPGTYGDKTINGVDDLLAAAGPDQVLALIARAVSPNEKTNQAGQLAELAADVELFHTPEHEAYARVPVNGHLETWPLKGKEFQRWLIGAFHKKYRKPPNAQALKDGLAALEADAQYDFPESRVYTRVAPHENGIYIDLGNAKWEVVEITAKGWQIVEDPPVRFRRRRGMEALPCPQPGGSIEFKRKYINLDHCCPKQDRVVPVPAESKSLGIRGKGIS